MEGKNGQFLRNASTVCDKGPTIAATMFSFQRCVIKADHEPLIRTEWGRGEWGPFEFTILALTCKGKITQEFYIQILHLY